MNDKTISFSSTEEVISLLQNLDGKNFSLNITISQTEETTLCKDADDPVVLLPRELKRKLIHRAAFRRAFTEGFLAIEEGEIVSRFRTPAALTYFLGRCFSNDKTIRQCSLRVWTKGDREFPATALNRLFGTTDLKEIRKNHLKNKIFAWSKEIDNLFVIS